MTQEQLPKSVPDAHRSAKNASERKSRLEEVGGNTNSNEVQALGKLPVEKD